MFENRSICEKINEIFPDVSCGASSTVSYDSKTQSWVLNFQGSKKELKTFLDSDDIDSCLSKGECIGLGLDVSLLKDHAG